MGEDVLNPALMWLPRLWPYSSGASPLQMRRENVNLVEFVRVGWEVRKDRGLCLGCKMN